MNYYNFHSHSSHTINDAQGKEKGRQLVSQGPRILMHLHSRPKVGPSRSNASWGQIT